MPNLLAGETSPYLLQHAANPVAWRPWGPDALRQAQASGRPILLSIGYAACHWCHVMAHESFEDSEVARLMNTLFVPVKVDREERPDLDAIYQQALAMMGQQGGWPLTMFLTPAGEPFYGGTYFPPAPRWGRPGFPDLLQRVAAVWEQRRSQVEADVGALRRGLADAAPAEPRPLSLEAIDEGCRHLVRMVDGRRGGLAGAPKFPQPGVFDLLWRAYLRTGDGALGQAVTVTLDNICRGGICDHLGGGFMRYSTDEEWLVPHFEKMLYDNAQLIDLLTLVWQRTGSPLYRARVAETVEWVLREMVAEGGAFASSLDADSPGGEGAFYTWTLEEIREYLDPEATALFAHAYDVTSEGNWEGRAILRRTGPPLAEDIEERLAESRAVLWRAREERPRPGRDDKILADWNGMMIAALANAAFVFEMPRWLDAARQAYRTVRDAMAMPDGRLAHSMRWGRVAEIGLLDDLAHMSAAGLTLAEVTGEREPIDDARRWAEAADLHFGDDAGGWFQTAAGGDVIVRLKPVIDNAIPSANGVMARSLARLGQVSGDDRFVARAEAAVLAFSGDLAARLPSMAALAAAFEQLAAPVEVVVAGTNTGPLLRQVAGAALPTRVLSVVRSPARATAVVCRAHACMPPAGNARQLRELLLGR
jgi:uncharacterized protein YyaL (SSP411 family)